MSAPSAPIAPNADAGAQTLIVDLGLGNLRSVERAVAFAAREAGVPAPITTRDPERVARAQRLVVPGQGAFRDGAAALDAEGGAMRAALLEAIGNDAHFLGICLGLQLLLDESDEAPGARGLGVVAGRVERIVRREEAHGLKVPHMGWNQPIACGDASDDRARELLHAAAEGSWFYFVHSFHAVPKERAAVAATAAYGPLSIAAMLRAPGRPNVMATQFHPEKSQCAGLSVLGNFLARERRRRS